MPRWYTPGVDPPPSEPPTGRYPTPFTEYDDVDPICGHHKSSRCQGCGVCVACDGCYCGEDDY